MDCFKYLGLYLDHNLSWNDHLTKLVNSSKYLIRVFYKLSMVLPQKLTLQCYHSLYHCHLRYMCLVWGSSTKNSIAPLCTIHNSIIKIIYKLPKLSPTKSVYTNVTVLPLEACIEYELALHMYKIVNDLIYTSHSLNYFYSSRLAKTIKLPPVLSTKYGTNSCLYKAISLYNLNAADLSNSLNTAKTQLSTFAKKRFLN